MVKVTCKLAWTYTHCRHRWTVLCMSVEMSSCVYVCVMFIEEWPGRMAVCCRLLIIFIFVFSDISVASLIFGFLGQADTSLSSYSFSTSVIEFWFFAIFRSAVLGGAVIGWLYNSSDSLQRLSYTWPASVVVAVLMMMFAVVKMLAYTEVSSHSALFWCQFSWMLVASVTFHAGFIILIRTRNVENIIVNTSINSENADQQPLLSGNSTEEVSSEKTTRKNMSVVFRLLSYSKPDAPLITVAFIFMVVSAVCKYYWYLQLSLRRLATNSLIFFVCLSELKVTFVISLFPRCFVCHPALAPN